MKLSQFKFKLPEEKIALHPVKYRDESRLMVVHKSTGEIEHVIFKDILNYFDDQDAFIFNDTKVFPARLYGNKEKTGARIEVFLLRELNEELRLWDVLVDPARIQESALCIGRTSLATLYPPSGRTGRHRTFPNYLRQERRSRDRSSRRASFQP